MQTKDSPEVSRLLRQLEAALTAVHDAKLSEHPFLQHWNHAWRGDASLGAHPASQRIRELCRHAEPNRLLIRILRAFNATWPAQHVGHYPSRDAALIDLCCFMSLIAFQRKLAGDLERSQTVNGVVHVGSFESDVAAMLAAAAALPDIGIRLRHPGTGAQAIGLDYVVSDHAGVQFGVAGKDVRGVIEDELHYIAHQHGYPGSRRTRFDDRALAVGLLDDLEQESGVRPVVALGDEQQHAQIDQALCRTLQDDWRVPLFVFARRLDERSGEHDLTRHFSHILGGPAVMAANPSSRHKVFISYAHKDEPRHLDDLKEHLGSLVRQGRLELWDDQKIRAGELWESQIESQLRECRVAVLLVSPAFLGSSFIHAKEVPPLLERHTQDGMLLMPVLIRHCLWEEEPWLASRQMRPGGTPLAERGAERDQQLAAIAREIAQFCR